MVKKSPSKFRVRPPRLRALPILGVALVLLGVAGVLLYRNYTTPAPDRFVNQLPADSYTVAVARLSRLDTAKLTQLATSANIGATAAPTVLTVVNQTLAAKDGKQAFADQFACGLSKAGTVCVFGVKHRSTLPAISRAIGSRVSEAKVTPRGQHDIITAKLDGRIQVSYILTNDQLLVGSTPELVAATVGETSGFTAVPQYRELNSQLPGTADGYLYFNVAPVQAQTKFSAPLTATAWRQTKAGYHLSAHSLAARPTAQPASGHRTLLPGDQFPFTVASGNLDSFLTMLIDQRQNSDLPSVLILQNGMRNLDKKLATTIEQAYLTTDSISYGRRITAEGNAQWVTLLEYDSASAATTKTTDLVQRVSQKLTVPIQKQVVKVLPDGTQSREIVSDTREPVQFTPVQVGAVTGQTTTVPGSVGPIVLATQDRWVVIGSDAATAQAALGYALSDHPKEHAAVAIRLRLREAGKLLNDPDAIVNWISVARPYGAELELNPAIAELTGSLSFK